MNVAVRRATAGAAKAVYDIMLRALQVTNARDYLASVIDRLASTLPEKVASKLEQWHACVASVDGQIVGTGSLNGRIVSSVFVDPDYQGRGIGSQLMGAMDRNDHARQGLDCTIIDHGAAVLHEARLHNRRGRLLRRGPFVCQKDIQCYLG